MPSAAFRRARSLMSDRRPAVTTARVLGVLQSLLTLALAAFAGLLISLLSEQGEARWPASDVDRLPPRLANAARGLTPAIDGRSGVEILLIPDTGLFATAANSQTSDDPLDRLFGNALLAVLRSAPPLWNNVGALTALLAGGLVLALVISEVARWRRAALAEASTAAAESLRRLIHRQMYRLGQSSLPTEGIGPVVNLFTREVNDVRGALITELDLTLRLPVLAVGLVLFAMLVSWTLTVSLAALGALVWLAAKALNRSALLSSQSATRDTALHLALLHEDLGLLRTVRVYGMESIDNQRFDEHLARFRDAESRRVRLEGTINPAAGLLTALAVALAIGLVGLSILRGRLSQEAALTLVGCLGGLIYPALGWLRLQQARRQGVRSAGAIYEFLERRPELQQAGGAQFLRPIRDRIQFENVTIESVSGRVLLEGVSLEIPARTRTAIMGPDEDAKHALVCLLPRLIDPKVGRVRIDGSDLRDVTLESIRAQVATVLQADLVFTDSVLANIGLGDPSYDLPRIIEAAKIAHAHNFIQDLPNGYDTVIGPLGHYLTVDQQYRIALARAYLHDPSIVIIEEPQTPLDDETRHLLDDTITRLATREPRPTLIFLPHRLSTIRSCDNVLVLQGSRVESFGPPRQLQGESKLFRHLQYIEFNQFATGEIEAGQMSS